MGNGLFQQQEWIGFLQTAFVTDPPNLFGDGILTEGMLNENVV